MWLLYAKKKLFFRKKNEKTTPRHCIMIDRLKATVVIPQTAKVMSEIQAKLYEAKPRAQNIAVV